MILRLSRLLGVVALGAPVLAGASGDLPVSKDALFDMPPVVKKVAKPVPNKAPAPLPESKDDLFGLDDKSPPAKPASATAGQPEQDAPASKAALFDEASVTPVAQDEAASRWHGFLQNWRIPTPPRRIGRK